MRLFSFFMGMNMRGWLLLCFLSPCVLAASLSQNIAGKVQNAFTFIEKGKENQALFILETLHLRSSYDKAYVNQLLGVLYWQQHRQDDAIEALTLAVNLNVLETKIHFSVQKMLADILLSDARYQDALPYYYALLKDSKISVSNEADIWLRVANGHFQLNQLEKALTAISQHLKVTKPKVSSLSLQVAIEQRSEKWTQAAQTLKQLIEREPMKKTWWLQLAASYQKLNQPKAMLETLILSKRSGITFSHSELLMLAQLYAQMGVPEKAARILSNINKVKPELASLVLEARYWQHAKEWDKSILAWDLAVKQDPQYAWTLARLQIQQGKYQDALTTLQPLSLKEASISKEKAAQIEIARANAYDKLGQVHLALSHAQKAHALSKTPHTENWLQYLLLKIPLQDQNE